MAPIRFSPDGAAARRTRSSSSSIQLSLSWPADFGAALGEVSTGSEARADHRQRLAHLIRFTLQGWKQAGDALELAHPRSHLCFCGNRAHRFRAEGCCRALERMSRSFDLLTTAVHERRRQNAHPLRGLAKK